MRHRVGAFGILGMAALWLTAWAPQAEAHWADQAVAEIRVDGAQARILLTFPTSLAAFADDDHDGQLSAQEVRTHRAELESFLGQHIRLADGDERGALAVEPAPTGDVAPGPGTHSTLLLVYRWSKPVQALAIHYELFVSGVSTASCLATIVYGGQVRNFVFTPERHSLTLAPGAAALWHQSVSFTALGIRHILTGYDHILFLLSLLMLGGGLRTLLKIVTAFTVAHSVTLSLAALDIVTLPPRLVESGIALSITYVAAENLWRGAQATRSRWLVTFSFGLIHGLGFATILRELAISRANLALSLVSFNFGVELGQIAVVTAAFLSLRALATFPWESTMRRWVSAAAVAIGIVWVFQRAFLA
jgi:hypothetical protein